VLTDTKLRNLKSQDKLYKVNDRDGLYVAVIPSGTISFRYNYVIHSRQETITFGRWRDLPKRFGDHQAVKRRYYRWIERGALDKFHAALTTEADLEWLMIDSTIVRTHQHAAGARRAKGGRMPRVWADHAVA
jgi:hypothetical protein